MKRWGIQIFILGVSLLSIGVGTQNVQAKSDPIAETYGALTSTNLYRPAAIKSSTNTVIDIVLKPKDKTALFQQALDVNTPGSSQFKNYLTPSDIRDKYGQPQSVTDAWKAYLAKHHLKTFVYDSGLLLTVSGKVKDFDQTFKMNMKTATYHSNPLQFSKTQPVIPASLADTVWTVLGMGNHNQHYVFPNAPSANTQGLDNTYAFAGYTKQFTDRYNVQSLYDQGLTGKGQTIGIIAFGGMKKSDAYHFWKHENASTDMSRLTVKNVPNSILDPKLSGGNDAETNMDVEYAGSVAPQADIRMYWNHNSVPTLVNMINAYSLAFNENKVSAISSSWGLGSSNLLNLLKARKVLTPYYSDVLNVVLAQGALQGISEFDAAGDDGGIPYSIGGISGNHVLLNRSANSTPVMESNPWVTSVGGTTLPFSKNFGTSTKVGAMPLGQVSVAKERSWGMDYLWPAFESRPNLIAQVPSLLSVAGSGGGGGFNKLVPTPAYQKDVSGVNTFNARNYLSNLDQPIFDSDLVHGTSTGRNYPDVSADADPMTGYMIYYPMGKINWIPSGGTSIASPQMAATAALINSQPGRKRMGFWNPQIYQLASQTDSPFHPLNDTTDNSNLYYTGQTGTVYNQASGLGTVDFAKLAQLYK